MGGVRGDKRARVHGRVRRWRQRVLGRAALGIVVLVVDIRHFVVCGRGQLRRSTADPDAGSAVCGSRMVGEARRTSRTTRRSKSTEAG